MSATKIQQGTFKHVDQYNGEAGETLRLAVAKLDQIEMPLFQRERHLPWIKKAAASWDRTAYAFPLVALFKSTLICLDGQQRLAALSRRGEIDAVVLLLEGVRTNERLASIFLMVNRDRRLLNAFEKYVAALSSKDPGTVDLDRIVAEHNLRIGKAASANGTVPAGAVAWIHENCGSDLLSRTLDVCVLAWDDLACKESLEGATLKGMATFLRSFGERTKDERLVNVLRRMHPNAILQAVQQGKGRVRTMSYAEFVRGKYNHGLPRKDRI